MSVIRLPSSVSRQVESGKRNGGYVLIPEGKGKTDLEWTIYNAKQVPGPDAYTLPTFSDGMKTGKFSTAAPPTYLDRIITESSRTPGPNDYNLGELDSIVNKPGGGFSNGKVPTFIELEELRSRSIPGPGAYKPRLATPSGGKFNEARPKSALDWIVLDAKTKPGPGAHVVRGKTRYDSKPASGGKFSTAVQKSFIQLEEERVSDHPSSQDYDVIDFPRGARKPRRMRKYSSTDSLKLQIGALDQMARNAGKKRHRKKKKRPPASLPAYVMSPKAIQLMNEDRLINTDMEDTPVATRQLLKYKVMKMDDIYAKYN